MVNDAMTEGQRFTATIPIEMAGMRFDQVLARLFPDYSRSRLQQWIREGSVSIDGKQLRTRDKVVGGEEVVINVRIEADDSWQAEPIPLDIVYEDDAILVINKPVGLIAHPGAGNRQGTMLNALLHVAPELATVPRAGIVHRLDKDTSGLLVIARSLSAQKYLVEQIQAHAVQREYRAIVCGVMTAGGSVDAPIGRHPVHRIKMAVVERGKQALTHYRVIERFRGHTYVSVQLETGRTHQIRVHMAHIHYPIVGDPSYGSRLRIPQGCSEHLKIRLQGFRRQALHATRLGLTHPLSAEPMYWEAPIPDDMQQLLGDLKQDMQDMQQANDG